MSQAAMTARPLWLAAVFPCVWSCLEDVAAQPAGLTDCSAFWAIGTPRFSTIRKNPDGSDTVILEKPNPSDPAQVVDIRAPYLCVEDFSRRGGPGAHVRVFYPFLWFDQPQTAHPALREIIEGLWRGMVDADEKLNAIVDPPPALYGLIQDTFIEPIAFPDHPPTAGVYTHWTDRSWKSERHPCPIVYFAPAGKGRWSMTSDTIAFITAHETAHCFQAWNYDDLWTSGHALWWLEGSATTIASDIYPEVDIDRQIAERFDLRTSLLDQTYGNVVFFNWLAYNKGLGLPGIFSIANAMPRNPARGDYRAAVGSVLSLDDFHQFGKDYLDDAIGDAGGRRTPAHDVDAPEHLVDPQAKHIVFLEHDSLSHGVVDVEFIGGDYDVKVDTTGEEKISWRESEPDGDWEDISTGTTVDSGVCGKKYRVLASGFEPSRDRYETALEITLSAPVERDRDRCLVGEWSLDLSNWSRLATSAADLIPGPNSVLSESADGDISLELGADGKARWTADAFRWRVTYDDSSQDRPDGTFSTDTIDDTAFEYEWWTADGKAYACSIKASGVKVSRVYRDGALEAEIAGAAGAERTSGNLFGLPINMPAGEGAAGANDGPAPDLSELPPEARAAIERAQQQAQNSSSRGSATMQSGPGGEPIPYTCSGDSLTFITDPVYNLANFMFRRVGPSE